MSINAELYATLDRELPVALLPVRLEMRYGTRKATTGDGVVVDGLPVLRVRIYPDEISLDSHQTGLTAKEIDFGRSYWGTLAEPSSGGTAATEVRNARAWELLTRRAGVHRAVYVAEATKPGSDPPERSLATPVTAELLPDRWVITGWQGKRRILEVMSQPVRFPLNVGPTPRNDEKPIIDPEAVLPVDEGMRWLADYDVAVAAGMAVTIDLVSPEDFAAQTNLGVLSRGLDSLFAFGIREPVSDERDPDSEAQALTELLNHHHARHGASFLLQGTSTNNLRDKRSGWSSRPDPYAVTNDRPPPSDGSNGAVTVAALGLNPGSLDKFKGSDAMEQRPARLMNEALFPVTWGELIGALLVPSEIDFQDEHIRQELDQLVEARSFARAHFLAFVRGRGPLPVLRLGRQPYGLLPVTDHRAWARQHEEPGQLAELAALLQRLRPFWDFASNQTPILPRELSDADAASERLLQILCTGPVPHPGSYGVRTVTGEIASVLKSSRPAFDVFETGNTLTEAGVDKFVQSAAAAIYRQLLSKIPGFLDRASLMGMEMQEPVLLTIPVAKKSGERSPAEYLAELGGAKLTKLGDATPWGGKEAPADLLYQLVHRALRLANLQSALAFHRDLLGTGDFYGELIAHPLELQHVAVNDNPSVLEALSAPLTAFAERISLERVPAAYRGYSFAELAADSDAVSAIGVGAATPRDPRPTREFLETQKAVLELGNLNLTDQEYERLLGETLATCGTRLDAWITSIATQRLDLLRSKRANGLQIGAYGWLINLPAWNQRSSPIAEGEAEKLPDLPGDIAQLLTAAQQVGYVHAPSLAQAETAAVLRAAELSHGSEASTVARLDLTSARVRTGKWILDAVQQGQPLPAVLGYRLERALHESSTGAVNLHAIVDDLRAHFPQRQAPRNHSDGEEAQEQVVPREVVDGLEVWTAWKNKENGENWLPDELVLSILGRLEKVLGSTDKAKEALVDLLRGLEEVLKSIDQAVEAVADLLVAEGVHQIVAGNSTRAAATLNAVAYGEPPPTDFDVVRTPRNGTSFTNRVVLALPPAPGGGPTGWNNDAPRSRLAPALEAWAARQLGEPARWIFDLTERRVDVIDGVMMWKALDAGEHLPDEVLSAADNPEKLKTTISQWREKWKPQLKEVDPAEPDGSREAWRLSVQSGEQLEQGLLADGFANVVVALRERFSFNGNTRRRQQLIKLTEVASLCALDVIQEATSSAGAQSLLEDRMVAAVDLPGALVRQPSELKKDQLGWDQLVAVAGVLRELIGSAKLLTVPDLVSPEEREKTKPRLVKVPKDELKEIKKLLKTLQAELHKATSALKNKLTKLVKERERSAATPGRAWAMKAADVTFLRKQLQVLTTYGVPGASQPLSIDDQSLLDSAIGAAAASERILLATTQALTPPKRKEATAEDFTLDTLLAGSRALLGPGMALTPRLGIDSALNNNHPEIQRENDTGIDPLDDWLARLARVRPAIAGLGELRAIALALDLPLLKLQVAQLPFADGDAWLGGLLAPKPAPRSGIRNELRPWQHPSKPTLHVVLATNEDFDAAAPLAGLVLDEFTEVLPASTQLTGAALHYNAPNARAPQSILLAVHPNPVRADMPWSWQMIEAMLADTLTLARLRTVELDQLARTAVTEFLPATYARDGLENIKPLHVLSLQEIGVKFLVECMRANRDLMNNG